MDSGPTSRAVGCSKKKKKKMMTKSLFCRYLYLTLMGCSSGTLPLQKHSKLSKKP